MKPVELPIVILALLWCAGRSLAADYVETARSPGAFCVVGASQAATIHVDGDDYPGVIRAAGDLAEDIGRVSGVKSDLMRGARDFKGTPILIGTIGKSMIIDQLVTDKKIDATAIRGQWEASVTAVVADPLPGVESALVIAGSDKRGTIYGIYELSEQMGVSPWYWWADVPVRRLDAVYVRAGTYVQGPPKVKYRGIFINDEEPALGGWARERFGGINSKMYTRMFELLLRLKGNYLWPAMWGKAFNEDDPENPRLADEYGIVMGTSHHEPMIRAQQEWKNHGKGPWNHATNEAVLKEFWRTGVERNKNYESIVTIGMRGDGDEPMVKGGDTASNIALLERIVADQRKLIAETINPDVTKVPQDWALYKEVADYYAHGMRVPDDVTLLWCDDNWGNARRLPTPEERKRSGGAGMYYHFDYVGGPRSYKWINTNPLPKIWEQMNLTYRYGADRIWIVNVGDLKPMELPISFFMELAWDPDALPKEKIDEFTRAWAQQQFGPEHADAIAEILSKYAKYNGWRKPELLEPTTFSLLNYQEAERVSQAWDEITKKAEEIYAKTPPESRDAFYQLVLYPTKASATVVKLYIAAGRNQLYARQRRASTNDQAELVRKLFTQDQELSGHYNHTMSGGKWNHMMDQTHIGYTSWNDPKTNVLPKLVDLDIPDRQELGAAIEGSSEPVKSESTDATLPIFDSINQQQHWIDVFKRGSREVEFTASADQSWIKLDKAEGKCGPDQRLWVSIDWKTAPVGDARGDITIARTGGGRLSVGVHSIRSETVARESLGASGGLSGPTAIEAEHATKNVEAAGARWEKIPDYGRGPSGMSIFPVTAPSVMLPEGSPHLEYKVFLPHKGDVHVDLITGPTLDFVPGRGLRLAVSFDDEKPQVVDAFAKQSYSDPAKRPDQSSPAIRDWGNWVKDNARTLTSTHSIGEPGVHTLKIWMVDPGVVLEKLVVHSGDVRPSYFGPPEGYEGEQVPTAPHRKSAAPTTLRDAVRDRFLIGAAVSPEDFANPQLPALLAEQFNSLTAGNDFKPDALQREHGKFTFDGADTLVSFAQQHGMKVIGHTLLWHEQAPAWMFVDEGKRPLPREKALDNLKTHIETVVKHFRGKVLGWDVVNEALSDRPDEFLRDTPALRAIGDGYIIKAFQFAQAADPNVQLYYNDYNIDADYKRPKALRLIRELKAAGCRIDAVGIQGHWLLDDPDVRSIDEAITQFGNLGVKVLITELDVDVLPRKGAGADLSATEKAGLDLYKNGLPDDVQQKLAARYRELFIVFSRHAGTLSRVTLWGVCDGNTWLNDWPVKGRTNHPLLWDRQLQPKPALGAVIDALNSSSE